MKKFYKNLSVSVLAIAFVIGFVSPTFLQAATAPSLGTADSFSVLAKPTMTAANPTTISGDLGLSTGVAITGTWTHTGGANYLGPATLAATARTDALAASGNLAGQATSGVWSLNANPSPGVWTTAVSAVFPGPTLTLNGGYNDVWVFQIGSDFTFTGNVVLAGNAQACNVFWQVGNDATIASGSNFVGTLIADNDVTVVSGATVNGRVLSLDGALTTDGNTISGPTCTSAPAALKIVKVVENGGNGTATVSSFNLYVKSSGINVSGSPAVGASSPGTSYGLDAGTYVVSEDANSSYTQSFSGACDSGGSVTLSSGSNVTCTITNTYITQSSSSSGSRTTNDPDLEPTNTNTVITTTTVETVPGLPVTGFEDKETNNLSNILIVSSILVLISIVLGRKKLKI